MGLDIMGYWVRNARKNSSDVVSIKQARRLANKRAKDRIRVFAKRSLSILEHTDADNYIEVYNKIFAKMPKYTQYSFRYEHMLDEVKSLDKVRDFFSRFVSTCYREEDIYFRKYNFVYCYFENKMVDEMCLVSKADMEDLVNRCDIVLSSRNEKVSMELLPTRGGFFFGSTEYNEYYYDDVEDCRREFANVLKKFNDETDVFYMWFSW